MSQINVNTITNRTGSGGPVISGLATAQNGLHVTGGDVNVTGIVTATTFSGNVNAGIITATSITTGVGSSVGFGTDVQITGNGNLYLANGNLVFSTSGTGIDFSATTDGSGTTTSELLDDYEEGTWTPTLSGFTNAGTTTGRVHNYTRIGNVVTIWFDIFQISNNMSFSNGATITGLPFSTAIPGGPDEFHTPVFVQYYRYPANTMVNVSAYVESADTINFRPASADSDLRHLWGHVTYLTS